MGDLGWSDTAADPNSRTGFIFGGLLLVELPLAAVLDPGRWHPVSVLLVVAALRFCGFLFRRSFGDTNFDAGSTVGLAVIYALFGVLPAVAATIAVRGAALVSGACWQYTMIDLASVVAGAITGGGLLLAATNAGWTDRADVFFGAWVVLATIAAETVNFLTILISHVMDGRSARAVFRESAVPVLPLELIAVGLAAAAVTAYTLVGLGAFVGVGVFYVALECSSQPRRAASCADPRSRSPSASATTSLSSSSPRRSVRGGSSQPNCTTMRSSASP
ncbi:MAG: hypothetical protein QOF76_2400 [Solirubrobacteraceae bacterium]|nr:hypothetical protein [Solirubrobacteraceae bacterium]